MSTSDHHTDFDRKNFLKTLPTQPGVYRIFDADGEVLYVGKARNLKNRVANYFRERQPSPRHDNLVRQLARVEVTVTHTEGEALLLENTLIKELKPRYNVLLRDDKSYPYIYLSNHEFPRLSIYRGAKNLPGRFFGPYPSAGAVRDTLNILQKVFQLRQCEDSFFNNRSRPCLQHQIKRCSAPCTSVINQPQYQHDVENTVLFLEGKSDQIIKNLVARMEQSATELDFEQAALYRDQIKRLRQVQERQHVSGERGNLDVVAVATQGGEACVQVFFFRDGRLLGNNHFFPKIPQGEQPGSVLNAFISQYYTRRELPQELVLSHDPEERELLIEALQDHAGHRVTISTKVRAERSRWLDMALRNARHTLAVQLSSKAGMRRRFEALQDALDLDIDISRMECFDISHTMGEATVASCVVFNEEGPLKSDYRRYNIEGITPGDDYAAMKQALTRRYTRIQQEEGKRPDILFIDGGKGQLTQARHVLQELQVDDVNIIGIAKGSDRKAGLEMLYRAENNQPLVLPSDSAALHLIQQIRDEAHRFAITGHRQRRAKARTTSVLEEIPGVGQKRRQSLLKQFGGLQQLSRAGVEDIAGVDGISRALAQRIYDVLHSDG